MSRHALIAGASIAGPALAFWLQRYGWKTTVIERAHKLREGGQNIDVRGAGREVVRRMGIEEEIRAATTGEQGTRFVNAEGETVAEFPADHSDTDGATAELEILRGDLARLLYEHTKKETTYVFGDHIKSMRQDERAVHVSFDKSAERAFDFVLAADGIGSTTRSLIVGADVRIEPVGLYTAWLTIPREQTDPRWALWHNATRGRCITLRPDTHGTTRAALSFLSDPRGYETLPVSGQKDVLRRMFIDAGWQAERILRTLDDAPDLYFEHVAQVKAPILSRGRAALVGDAGYCASPISGMGTSLAFVGAFILAGELARCSSHTDAFANYERLMRPYVDKAQRLPFGAPRIANPKSKLGIRIFHEALRIAASPRVKSLGSIFSPPADEIDLPSYVTASS